MNLIATIPYDAFMFGPYDIWGPLKIHSFGLFVAIGLLTTFTLCSRKGEMKLGISGEEVQNFGIYLVVIGWLFSHVFDVIFYRPHDVAQDPLIIFKFWGSISSYGGLFGGIAAAWIWRWRHPDKDFLLWADLAAWGLTFSWFFGRVGCSSVHDHPGKIVHNNFFLAVSGWPDGTTRYELGFYEAIWWAVICITVLILDRKPRPKGFYLALVPTMYAPARFGLDFLRVTDKTYFGLTPAQYSSFLILAVGIYFWIRIRGEDPIEWKQYEPEKAE